MNFIFKIVYILKSIIHRDHFVKYYGRMAKHVVQMLFMDNIHVGQELDWCVPRPDIPFLENMLRKLFFLNHKTLFRKLIFF